MLEIAIKIDKLKFVCIIVLTKEETNAGGKP